MHRLYTIRARRGSALILTIAFTIVVGIVSASFLDLALTTYKLASNTSMQTASYFLAEAGTEEGIRSARTYSTDEEWIDAGWVKTPDGQYWQQTAPIENEALQLDFGTAATVRILVEDPSASRDIAVLSEGHIDRGNLSSSDAFDAVLVRLAAIDVPSFKGLIARNSLTFNGRPQFDSYDSRKGTYGQVVNGEANVYENVTVGSTSDANGSVDLGNADVYGDVVSGSSNPGNGAVSAGPGATVTGDVIGDYKQVYPMVTPPDTSGWRTAF